MSGAEDVPGGLTESDCLAIATALSRTGMIDFINVVKGSIATDEALSHVIPGLGTPLGPGLELAGRFRERSRPADLPRRPDRGRRDRSLRHRRGAGGHGRDDAGAHGRPAHRPKARGGGGRPDPAVRRGVVLPQPDLRRSRRPVHPQRRDRARGDGPAAHGPEHGSAPDGRRRGRGAGRPGGGPRRGRARPPGHPARGGVGSRRADPPRGAGDSRGSRISSASSTGSSSECRHAGVELRLDTVADVADVRRPRARTS